MNNATPESPWPSPCHRGTGRRVYAEVFRARLRGSSANPMVSTFRIMKNRNTGSLGVSDSVNEVTNFRINAGLGRRGIPYEI